MTTLDRHEYRRVYIIFNDAWYAEANRSLGTLEWEEEIMVGYEHEGGGGDQFSFRWYKLQSGEFPTARLEAFDDSFQALAFSMDLIHALSFFPNGIMPSTLVQVLKSLGFEDVTPRENPHEMKGVMPSE